MARPRLRSGPNEILDAEQLFLKSVKQGSPDFRYIALAIGENPFRPPLWAIWECICERDKAARKVASGHSSVSLVIDEMVRFLAREQFLREDRPARRHGRPPSLRKAILTARDIVAARQPLKPIMGYDQTETGFIKLMERLWNREQKEDEVESHYMLFHWKVTKRIDEIIHGMVAEEFGHPPHIEKALWMANVIDRVIDGDK